MQRLAPSKKFQALLAERAHGMRHAETPSEQRLWLALCRKQLGVRFRRQVVCGRFILDFFAPEARLVVEVDGAVHLRQQRADARRDEKLSRLGYRVLRVAADDVHRDLPGVLARIRAALLE